MCLKGSVLAMLSAFAGASVTFAQTQVRVTCLDYRPAPGQFVNTLPAWSEGETQKDMNAKVTESQNGTTLTHLGGWGGYTVLSLSTPITNVVGCYDFYIKGNSFQAASSSTAGGSCEPGVIFVAQADKDGNPGTWYQIAGSEYEFQKKVRCSYVNYEHEAVKSGFITDLYYMKVNWLASDGSVDSTTYVQSNSFHKQNYWPEWISNFSKGETYEGVLLPANGRDESNNGTYYVQKFFQWGYADNQPNSSEFNNIDIDWAVDDNGWQVNLDHIDFIKVQTGIHQSNGWIGECSTEISGVYDITANNTSSKNVKFARVKPTAVTPVQVYATSTPTSSMLINVSADVSSSWELWYSGDMSVAQAVKLLYEYDDRFPIISNSDVTFGSGITWETINPKKVDIYTSYMIASVQLPQLHHNRYHMLGKSTLTFEDSDYKGSEGAGYWSSKIDSPQYGGALLYNDYNSADYSWYDEFNTGLSFDCEGQVYWVSGHAVSNYVLEEGMTADYNKLSIPVGYTAHSGSNFCVHFGYHDSSNSYGKLPKLTFPESTYNAIGGLWVLPTAYYLDCAANGNAYTDPCSEGDSCAITATGYRNGSQVYHKYFNITSDGQTISDWAWFELDSTAIVDYVEFNMVSNVNNDYGMALPAYFAYDDVVTYGYAPYNEPLAEFTTDIVINKYVDNVLFETSDVHQFMGIDVTTKWFVGTSFYLGDDYSQDIDMDGRTLKYVSGNDPLVLASTGNIINLYYETSNRTGIAYPTTPIKSDGMYYDFAGRIIKPIKGKLYIHNGKLEQYK